MSAGATATPTTRVSSMAQGRRALLCAAIPLAEIFFYGLWRGPMPGRAGSFGMGVLLTTVGVYGTWRGLRPAEVEQRDAPTSFLSYDRFRFTWLAVGVTAAAIGAYLFDAPPGGRSGGSWLGYMLGTVCFAAMVWLMWFGIRKRSYTSRGAPLRAWLSGHVYLGLALLIIMPLHSAFQFGWNIHMLAMALAIFAILTGLAGLSFYTRVPSIMTRNRPGQKLEGLLQQIADIDERCSMAAKVLPDSYVNSVKLSIEQTRIGGGIRAQLLGHRKGATAEALKQFGELIRSEPLRGEAADRRQELVELLAVKERLLRRVGQDVRLKALLDMWLLIHVPVAFGSVFAAAVHIFVVFYYR